MIATRRLCCSNRRNKRNKERELYLHFQDSQTATQISDRRGESSRRLRKVATEKCRVVEGQPLVVTTRVPGWWGSGVEGTSLIENATIALQPRLWLLTSFELSASFSATRDSCYSVVSRAPLETSGRCGGAHDNDATPPTTATPRPTTYLQAQLTTIDCDIARPDAGCCISHGEPSCHQFSPMSSAANRASR